MKNLSNGKLEAKVMCFVPISVGHKNSPKMLKIYAMAVLDKCNKASFTKDELIENLEITGRKLQLNIKKLTGEKSEWYLMIQWYLMN